MLADVFIGGVLTDERTRVWFVLLPKLMPTGPFMRLRSITSILIFNVLKTNEHTVALNALIVDF